MPQAGVSVGIVAICGEDHLGRCLASLAAQQGAPAFDIVVAAAPRLGPLHSITEHFPAARLLDVGERETPVELAASVVGESRGDVILLTEDHCSAHRDWVATLYDAIELHRRVVGGSLDPVTGMTPFDWAFFFVDFHRYTLPRRSGPATSVSVCNAGYRREDLAKLKPAWRDGFHETRVHDQLLQSCGPHHFEAGARMLTGRMVGYGEGHRERYAFGRMFAAGRMDQASRFHRVLYSIGAMALPALLLMRMGASAARERATAAQFIRSLPHIVTLVLAWSWGEFLGYATGTLPLNRDAARER